MATLEFILPNQNAMIYFLDFRYNNDLRGLKRNNYRDYIISYSYQKNKTTFVYISFI